MMKRMKVSKKNQLSFAVVFFLLLIGTIVIVFGEQPLLLEDKEMVAYLTELGVDENADGQITAKEMESLSGDITIENVMIKDYSALSHAVNIESLTINSPYLKTPPDISKLTKLLSLQIHYFAVPEAIKVLGSSDSLQHLEIYESNLQSLDGIEQFPNLITSTIGSMNSLDLAALQNNKTLESLYVTSQEGLTNEEVLKTMKSLTYISLFDYLSNSTEKNYLTYLPPSIESFNIPPFLGETSWDEIKALPNVKAMTVTSDMQNIRTLLEKSPNTLQELNFELSQPNLEILSLKKFSNLQTLNIRNSDPSVATNIADLPTKLSSLTLSNIRATDDLFSSIQNQKQLYTLILENVSNLRDLAFLRKLPLDSLHIIGDNSITTLEPLKEIVSLSQVTVKDSAITSIAPLEELPSLTSFSTDNRVLEELDVSALVEKGVEVSE